MMDDKYTQLQLDNFLTYIANVRKALNEGVVSDPTLEVNEFFERYVDIHQKVAKARSHIQWLRTQLDRIQQPELQTHLAMVLTLLKDVERFLDNAEEGSFRTLVFQAQHRQSRAFDEIERRIDRLYEFTGKLVEVWRNGA